MNEANIDLSAPDSTQELQEVTEGVDDRLLTRRLPAITPPPPRVASVAPSSPAPPYAPSGTYRAPPPPRSSWWHALLTATFPPQMAAAAPTDERVLRRRVGATCAGMALGFVILALALGLRGAEPAFSPTVGAALVVARAVVSVGFLGFGYGLLRMAERFFLGGTDRSGQRSDLN